MNLFQVFLAALTGLVAVAVAIPASIAGFLVGALCGGFNVGADFATGELPDILEDAWRRLKEGPTK